MKKLVSLILVAIMLCLSCAALAEAPEGYPAVVEGIDFDGATLYIDYYWSPASRSEDPTDEQQDQYDYRDWIMATYNVNVVEEQLGDWSSQVNEIVNFKSAPDGSLRIIILPPDFVGSPMANDVFAAWNGEGSLVNFEDEVWNQAIINFMTKADKVYGVATGATEPRQCLFFNKRVLEEANVNWEEIYDMQEAGTWTWDALETILKTVQRDTDNDGVNNVFGMTGSNMDLYLMGAFSNGGTFFEYDAEGKLQISANSDNTLEGLAWAKDLWANYSQPQPEGANWDYYKDQWKQGESAFYMYQTYGGFNENSEMADMDDEWGCVAFPIGPKGTTYLHIATDNIAVIPNVYDDATIAKMAYIYQLWNTTTPGYEDDEYSWVGQKLNFTDDRAVYETYAMLRESEHSIMNTCLLLGSTNDVLGQDCLWNLSWQTAVECIEAKMPNWVGMLEKFNGGAE